MIDTREAIKIFNEKLVELNIIGSSTYSKPAVVMTVPMFIIKDNRKNVILELIPIKRIQADSKISYLFNFIIQDQSFLFESYTTLKFIIFFEKSIKLWRQKIKNNEQIEDAVYCYTGYSDETLMGNSKECHRTEEYQNMETKIKLDRLEKIGNIPIILHFSIDERRALKELHRVLPISKKQERNICIRKHVYEYISEKNFKELIKFIKVYYTPQEIFQANDEIEKYFSKKKLHFA